MSVPTPPQPAKLVIGFFLKEKRLAQPVVRALVEAFGQVDCVSPWFAFDYTDYYEPEMGRPLFRRVLAFKGLIQQRALADIKITTNELEVQFAQNGQRMVNLDPGYLLLERFVLATGKNYSHRIYIGRQIYADLTLMYVKGRFQKLPWTYPDYADHKMLDCLSQIRSKYVVDLKTDATGSIDD